MSAHLNIRSCSPLKTVFNRLGDTYQTYCTTYKTHAMATHYRGARQPLDRDDTLHGKDTKVNIPHDYHHEDASDFATIEEENHTNLSKLTWELDDLHLRVQAGESQPMEALHHIECELQKLSMALCPSVPLELLNDVPQQYMETLCSSQKQTNFMNTLIQDIPIFNGNNSTQVEDWLVDIETTANLTDESRTKLAQGKSKGLYHTLIAEALTLGGYQRFTPFKTLQLRHSCFSKPLYGNSTEGEGIFSSLYISP